MANVTVLTYPETNDLQPSDMIYMVRGTGPGRDRRIPGSVILPQSLSVATTQAVDLSTYPGDLLILATGTITLTLNNTLVTGKQLTVRNAGVGTVTLAGALTETIVAGMAVFAHSDGTDMKLLLPYVVKKTASAYVVNDAGEDVDFRVGGVGQPNLIFADAANNRIGINTIPDTMLHLKGYVRIKLERDSNTKIMDLMYSPAGILGPTNHQWNLGVNAVSDDFRLGSWDGSTVRQVINFKPQGEAVIGGIDPTPIHASAVLFAGVKPKVEIITGNATGAYEEFVSIRHPVVDGGLALRRLGLLLKLSYEGDLIQSEKMGGLVLDSEEGGANNPKLHLVVSDVKQQTITSAGKYGFGTENPESRFHIKDTVNVMALLESTAVNSFARWASKNDAQRWSFGVDSADNFVIVNETNAWTPFWIAPGAPADSIYISPTGQIAMGTFTPASNKYLDVVFPPDTYEAGVIFQNVDGAIALYNGTGMVDKFSPVIRGTPKGSDQPMHIISRANPVDDTGTTPLILIRAHKNGAPIANRPLLSIQNYITEIMRVEKSGLLIGPGTIAANKKLDVVFADDTFGAGIIARNSDGTIALYNGTGVANEFTPVIEGAPKGTGQPMQVIANTAAGYDSGSVAVMQFRAKINNANVAVRPLFSFLNNTTEAMTLDKDSNLKVSGGLDIGNQGKHWKVKEMNIGDWNMDVDGSKAINHGLTADKIRIVFVVIREDGNTQFRTAWEATGTPGPPTELALKVIWTTTQIILIRLLNGAFDNINHDATGYNRGWLTIFYLD